MPAIRAVVLTHSAGSNPDIQAIQQFGSRRAAGVWVTQQIEAWKTTGEQVAKESGGSFDLDFDPTETIDPEQGGTCTANDGEELLIVAVR